MLEVYYKFILAFGLVLVAARIVGEFFDRYLKQPAVIGELIAGMIIGPFALGSLAHDPIILNFATISAFGVDEFHIMEIISEMAVISLLFVAGVETDVNLFLRQGITGALAAIGGVILPFIFGYLITWFMYPGVGLAGWLFMGAALTATSIGITVRILMDMGRLWTKEGTTILVAAVIDDIIGIVILSVVISVAGVVKLGGIIDIEALLLYSIEIIAMGVGAWIALLFIGVKLNKYISRFILSPFRASGTSPIFAIIMGFLISWLVTKVHLHPVVGAYASGLMFSSCEEREEIIEKTRPIMLFLAPFFFSYIGMQVNIIEIFPGIIAAIVLLIAAIAGKIIGCYIPARIQGGFSHTSALIVGIGMVPRGEVGLIIASAGLLSGAIDRTLYGAAVFISVMSTILVPSMLKPLLRKSSKGSMDLPKHKLEVHSSIQVMNGGQIYR